MKTEDLNNIYQVQDADALVQKYKDLLLYGITLVPIEHIDALVAICKISGLAPCGGALTDDDCEQYVYLENKVIYTKDDWKRDGTLNVQVGQIIAPEVFYQLRDSVPPALDARGYFQPGEAYDFDLDLECPRYMTFRHVGGCFYRYLGLDACGRFPNA